MMVFASVLVPQSKSCWYVEAVIAGIEGLAHTSKKAPLQIRAFAKIIYCNVALAIIFYLLSELER